MKQLELENMDAGLLPDGTEIKVGDIIIWSVAMHTGVTKVILKDGKLSMEKNGYYGDGQSIDRFLFENGQRISYNTIEVVSLTELYKFCKKNNWDTAKYIIKFGKKLI